MSSDLAEGDLRRFPRLPRGRLENARVLTDRYDLLAVLPRQARMAQLGVGTGGFTQHILDVCAPAHLLAIDRFETGLSEHDYRRGLAAPLDPHRMTVSSGEAIALLGGIEAESLDCIWLDMDCRYDSVVAHLAAIRRCVKPDGWLVVSGYAARPGNSVVRAVHEFIVQADCEMLYLALAPEMLCDVAIRRVGVAQSLLSIQQENVALRHSLAVMRHSVSWRATGPLRAASWRATGPLRAASWRATGPLRAALKLLPGRA